MTGGTPNAHNTHSFHGCGCYTKHAMKLMYLLLEEQTSITVQIASSAPGSVPYIQDTLVIFGSIPNTSINVDMATAQQSAVHSCRFHICPTLSISTQVIQFAMTPTEQR